MNIIISVLVGAIIGYFTNWLAIKMLFRPHEEKRILGFKVPFTPGLIPKERGRIAESIGEAVGEHLLTPEKISEVLASEETRVNINNWLNLKLNKLKENDKSILDILEELEIDNYKESLERIKEKILNTILSKLNNERFKKEILQFIEEDIYEKYKNIAWENLHVRGRRLLREISNSKEIKVLIMKEIEGKIECLLEDNRKLKDILSQETIDNIYESIDNNKSNIILELRSFLHDPYLERRLKTSIGDLIDKNISKVITAFVSTDIIAEKVFQIIYKYINSKEAEEMAIFVIKNSIDKILDNEISDLTNNIMKFTKGDEIEKLVDIILPQLINEDNQDKLVEIFIENIKSKDIKIKTSLIDLLDEKIDDILESAEFKERISKIIDTSTDGILNMPIFSILNYINNETIIKSIDFIREIGHNFGHGIIMEIINLFDISKIVEEQINSFDVEYTEKLIIDIADKELKAITRLGALLGGIMGVLSPLLQIWI